MRKIILTLLMLLALSCPVQSSPSLYQFAQKGIFLLTHPDVDPDNGQAMTAFGTGFCRPGASQFVVTANHVVGPDMTLVDSQGVEHKTMPIARWAEDDVALVMVEDKVCELNGFEWGKKNADPGTPAWTYGFGAGLRKPLLVGGMISSEEGALGARPHAQMAQLNAVHGHSGAPVFDSANKVIGMVVGGIEAGDEINGIVSVETLKKLIK